MAKNKTRIADATRCLMCYQPICDIACQKKVFPAGIIHALHLKNEAGAYLRSAENVSCLHRFSNPNTGNLQICIPNEKHITREHTSRVVGQLLWHQM